MLFLLAIIMSCLEPTETRSNLVNYLTQSSAKVNTTYVIGGFYPTPMCHRDSNYFCFNLDVCSSDGAGSYVKNTYFQYDFEFVFREVGYEGTCVCFSIRCFVNCTKT